MNKYFESEPHSHLGRLSKRELALHLTHPHLRPEGNWSSMADGISHLMKWTRDELERQHAEFHSQWDLATRRVYEPRQ